MRRGGLGQASRTARAGDVPDLTSSSEVGDLGPEGVLAQAARNKRAPPRSHAHAKDTGKASSSD